MKRAAIACLLVALAALACATASQEDTTDFPDVTEVNDDLDVAVTKDAKGLDDKDDSQNQKDGDALEGVPGDGNDDDSKQESVNDKDADESEDILSEDLSESKDDLLLDDLDEEEDVEESRHNGEARSIRRLLAKIKAKLRRELAKAHGYVRSVIARENRRVRSALKKYKNRNARLRRDQRRSNRALGAYRAARRLRAKRIRGARSHASRAVHRRRRELLIISAIECRLLQLTGNNRAAKKCIRNHNRNVHQYHSWHATRGVRNVRTWSGYCRSHSRGNGWARYCTNGREFNQAAAFIKHRSNGVFTARRSGYFRLRFHTIQYCANWCPHHTRVLIGGNQVDYAYNNHQHSWTHNENDLVWYVKKGQNIQFQAYVHGSNPYRWHSGNGRGAHSRVQISYMGRHYPVHSSRCTGSRGSSWQRYCNNKVEFSNGHFFRRRGSMVQVKRPGFYRVNARSIVYTRGWGPHYARVYVRRGNKNQQISFTHDYNVYWARVKSDVMWPLKAGDRVYTDYYSNRGHAYHSGNSQGAHSRFQMSYEGHLRMPALSYGCSHHDRRSRKWRTYCLNRREFNTASRFLKVYGNGMIRVLRSGTYRINAWALQHPSSYRSRNTRVLINGSYRSYGYTHAKSWNRNGNDFIWRLKRGQKIHVQYYIPHGQYTFHSGTRHSRVQVTYMGSY